MNTKSSDTTRQPRPGEQHGVHYYYTERAKMEEMIKNGEFLENAKFGDNLYGTRYGISDVI